MRTEDPGEICARKEGEGGRGRTEGHDLQRDCPVRSVIEPAHVVTAVPVSTVVAATFGTAFRATMEAGAAIIGTLSKNGGGPAVQAVQEGAVCPLQTIPQEVSRKYRCSSIP